MQCANPGVFKWICYNNERAKTQSMQTERINLGEPQNKKNKKYKDLYNRLNQ